MVALWGFTRGFSGGSRSIGTRIKTWRFMYSIQSRASSFSTNPIFGGGDDGVLPVLIVGAGPVGLVLSILLTKLGVKCAVLEKSNKFSEHPQAHFVNNRSMECYC